MTDRATPPDRLPDAVERALDEYRRTAGNLGYAEDQGVGNEVEEAREAFLKADAALRAALAAPAAAPAPEPRTWVQEACAAAAEDLAKLSTLGGVYALPHDPDRKRDDHGVSGVRPAGLDAQRAAQALSSIRFLAAAWLAEHPQQPGDTAEGRLVAIIGEVDACQGGETVDAPPPEEEPATAGVAGSTPAPGTSPAPSAASPAPRRRDVVLRGATPAVLTCEEAAAWLDTIATALGLGEDVRLDDYECRIASLHAAAAVPGDALRAEIAALIEVYDEQWKGHALGVGSRALAYNTVARDLRSLLSGRGREGGNHG